MVDIDKWCFFSDKHEKPWDPPTFLVVSPFEIKDEIIADICRLNSVAIEWHLQDFVFWDLHQVQYKNPQVQIVIMKNMTPTPFIRVWLDDASEVRWIMNRIYKRFLMHFYIFLSIEIFLEYSLRNVQHGVFVHRDLRFAFLFTLSRWSLMFIVKRVSRLWIVSWKHWVGGICVFCM